MVATDNKNLTKHSKNKKNVKHNITTQQWNYVEVDFNFKIYKFKFRHLEFRT